MLISSELASATDAVIEKCVGAADTLILRGLLYQLTGDEEVLRMELIREPFGYSHVDRIAQPSEVALLQKKASDLLKSYRDRGEVDVSMGPAERLYASLSLMTGVPLPEAERDIWIEETGLDPMARGLKWNEKPGPEQLASFKVGVIGSGLSGLNAAVHLKSAGIPYVLIEKNPEVGGTWYENQYPGARVDSPSRGYQLCGFPLAAQNARHSGHGKL